MGDRDPEVCPAPGCGADKAREHALCGRCWRMVPGDLRGRVWRTWRALEAVLYGGAEDFGEDYREARAAWETAVRLAGEAAARRR